MAHVSTWSAVDWGYIYTLTISITVTEDGKKTKYKAQGVATGHSKQEALDKIFGERLAKCLNADIIKRRANGARELTIKVSVTKVEQKAYRPNVVPFMGKCTELTFLTS